MKISLIAICLFLIQSTSWANPLWSIHLTEAATKGAFSAGIGSSIELQSSENSEVHSGVLLGELISHEGNSHSVMVLDNSTSTVKYISSQNLSAVPTQMQSVLKLYAQQGGTCTAYAIDDFLLQMQLSGFEGNGNLSSDVSSEEGRTALLADAINQYYLVLQHRFSILGILKKYGAKYNFSCHKIMFNDPSEARQFLINSLDHEFPVLVSFMVGNTMTNGPFDLEKIGLSQNTEDVSLWLPRKIGQRKSGGHSVVAAGSFTVGEKKYLVILDSDWDLPRVWDLDEAISDRVAINELEFYTCQ